MTMTLEELGRVASTCTKCRLANSRTIGEGPGYHEDQQGEPFVGAAGQLLTTMLGEIGLRREDVYICNVLKCRPPGNRDPLPDEVESCTPYLQGQIELVDPKVIVTLGNFATRFVLGRQVSISRVRGQRLQIDGRIVIPTFHPAAILRGGGAAGSQMAALRSDFQEVRAVIEDARRPVAAVVSAEEQLGLF